MSKTVFKKLLFFIKTVLHVLIFSMTFFDFIEFIVLQKYYNDHILCIYIYYCSHGTQIFCAKVHKNLSKLNWVKVVLFYSNIIMMSYLMSFIILCFIHSSACRSSENLLSSTLNFKIKLSISNKMCGEFVF